ncbi:MAG: hypothetical protein RIS28_890, partial [Bacteroidota bacterium]
VGQGIKCLIHIRGCAGNTYESNENQNHVEKNRQSVYLLLVIAGHWAVSHY